MLCVWGYVCWGVCAWVCEYVCSGVRVGGVAEWSLAGVSMGGGGGGGGGVWIYGKGTEIQEHSDPSQHAFPSKMRSKGKHVKALCFPGEMHC